MHVHRTNSSVYVCDRAGIHLKTAVKISRSHSFFRVNIRIYNKRRFLHENQRFW